MIEHDHGAVAAVSGEFRIQIHGKSSYGRFVIQPYTAFQGAQTNQTIQCPAVEQVPAPVLPPRHG